ncbi:hypothetical protein Bbelb_222380 [Branchiostoma belcheri]|nr:hypothetical protein Bbelb_222380 [Branchiostoma belcheri]
MYVWAAFEGTSLMLAAGGGQVAEGEGRPCRMIDAAELVRGTSSRMERKAGLEGPVFEETDTCSDSVQFNDSSFFQATTHYRYQNHAHVMISGHALFARYVCIILPHRYVTMHHICVRHRYVCIMLPHVPRMSVRSTWFAITAVWLVYVCIMLPHVPRMSVRSTWFAITAVWLVSMLLAIPAAIYSKAASYIWKGGTFCVQAWPIKHETR